MAIHIPNSKLFIPKSSINLVKEHFGELPHITAEVSGRLLTGSSTKNVRLQGDLVTKEWTGTDKTQLALNELRGSTVAKEILKTLGQIHGLPEYLKRIHIPNTFAYEAGDKVVLVSDFFDRAEELTNISAMQLPVELRASAALIVKSLGLNQFPTSSLLTRMGESGIEECIIDLETAFSNDKADFTTEVFFSLLRESSKKDGSLNRFIEIVSEGGDKWHERVHDSNETILLIRLLTEAIGIIEGTTSPEEVIQTLQVIVKSFKNNGYAIEEMITHPQVEESHISFDDEFMKRFISREKSLKTMGNDSELLKEIIITFFDESKNLLLGAKESLESRDFIALKRCGHTMKSSIYYFCKENSEVLQAALDLELAGKLKDYESSRIAIDKLNLLMPEFFKAVKMLSMTL